MSTLANKATVRKKAKEYGMLIRNESVRTNDDFLDDVERVFETVLFWCVKYQDDQFKKTLVPSEWSARQINKAEDFKKDIIKARRLLQK